MNEIGYCICARSGNYIATWINPALPSTTPARRQQIVVLYRAFLRTLPATDRRVTGSTQYVSNEQLEELGFIVPPVETEATAYELPYQPKPVRLLWEAEPDSGWTDDYFDGLLVRDNGALYIYEGNPWLALVEPTETDGLYRIDGPDLQLISKKPLKEIFRMLSGMSALDFLLKVMPDVMLPDEMPI